MDVEIDEVRFALDGRSESGLVVGGEKGVEREEEEE